MNNIITQVPRILELVILGNTLPDIAQEIGRTEHEIKTALLTVARGYAIES